MTTTKNQPDGPRQAWTEPFIQVVSDFADTVPLLGDKTTYSALSFCADRLKGLVNTLTEAPLEESLSKEQEQLVEEGIARLETILCSLKTQSLTGPRAQFSGFDEVDFADRLQNMPLEDYISVYRQAIKDPQHLTNFEAVTRTTILTELGVPIAAVIGIGIILFKVIAILILKFLEKIFPSIKGFIQELIKVLESLDKAGENKNNEKCKGGQKIPPKQQPKYEIKPTTYQDFLRQVNELPTQPIPDKDGKIKCQLVKAFRKSQVVPICQGSCPGGSNKCRLKISIRGNKVSAKCICD